MTSHFDQPPSATTLSSIRPGGMVQPITNPQAQPTSSAADQSMSPADAHHLNNASKPVSKQHPVVQIRTVFMDEQMQGKAVELAKEACMNERMAGSPREIAGHLKLAFDQLYGPAWHCVVGRSFGSFVTHGISTLIFLYLILVEKDSFIFFYVDQWAIMLFRTIQASV